ncbi:MAG: DUF4097 family beta strand repeat protein [Chloroflexi bacterium]|nr:DUF4097 family beta strand repeat protein [Chloroflexota bacterium]
MTHFDDDIWTADAPLDQQLAGDDVRQVMIDAGHGDLDVAWHESNTVLVHGPSAAAERQADTLVIHRRRKGDRLAVTLPQALPTCTISVHHGRLTLTGSRGIVQASTGSGSIHVEDGQGELTLHTGSGSIHVERQAGPLAGKTGSGSVHLANIDGPIEAQTGSGSIRVTGGAGDLQARTGSGAIRVETRVGGRLSLTTGSGSIRIDGGQAAATDARTGSGSIHCSAVLGPARHELTTNVGSIALGVPRGLPARIEATTPQGSIHTTLPLVTVGQRGPKSLFGRRLVGSLGEGESRADISLRTGRGDIRLGWLDDWPVTGAPGSAGAPDDAWSNVSSSLGRAVGDLAERITRDVASALAPEIFPTRPTPIPRPAAPDGGVPAPPPLPVGRAEPAFLPTPPPAAPPTTREAEQRRVLAALATGEITVAEAERLLAALETHLAEVGGPPDR